MDGKAANEDFDMVSGGYLFIDSQQDAKQILYTLVCVLVAMYNIVRWHLRLL